MPFRLAQMTGHLLEGHPGVSVGAWGPGSRMLRPERGLNGQEAESISQELLLAASNRDMKTGIITQCSIFLSSKKKPKGDKSRADARLEDIEFLSSLSFS